MKTEYDENQFQQLGIKVKVIEKFGPSYWEVTVLESEEPGVYYLRGPFGRWDAIVYQRLSNINSKEELESQIKLLRDAYSKL